MNQESNAPNLWWFGLAMVGIALYRVWVSYHNGLPLYVDEAYYWTWAKQLDWGYFSKPPMVALGIAGTTSVLGDSEFGVRFLPLILHPLTAALVFLLGRKLYSTQVGVWAALFYFTMPAVSLSSMVVSTDALLLFFWALSAWVLIQALESEEQAVIWWLLVGVSGGLGLMSKYTMGMFAISALLVMALVPSWRHWFLRPGPYLAAFVALLILSPNLWWNYQQGFPTFVHTADITRVGAHELSLAEFQEFLGGQFLVFGPVLFLSLFLLVFTQRWWSRPGLFLMAFTLPLLLLVMTQALTGRANANWAVPVYLTGAILVAEFLLTTHRAWRYLSVIFALVLSVMVYHFEPIAKQVGWELTRSTDPFKRHRGWDQVGVSAAEIINKEELDGVVANDRDLLSHLAYYGDVRLEQLFSLGKPSHPKHQFDLVSSLQERSVSGKTFLLMIKGEPSDELLRVFKRVDYVGELVAEVYPDYIRKYEVYRLTGHGI